MKIPSQVGCGCVDDPEASLDSHLNLVLCCLIPCDKCVLDLKMSKRLPDRSVASDTIAKLISAGYLDPDHRHDPAAITNAIARMKMDLRGRTGSEYPRTD
jgi:hypothetical protein